jgi:MFS family permease
MPSQLDLVLLLVILTFSLIAIAYAGPSWGWRWPFVIVALPTVALAALTWYTVGEPQRGITEAALQGEYNKEDFEYEEKIDWEKTKALVRIRTNLCVILQVRMQYPNCNKP